MTDEFERLVEVLNSAPGEQCVLRAQFLGDLGIDAEVLGAAAGRPVRSASEYFPGPVKNMLLRDNVFVFGAKRESA